MIDVRTGEAGSVTRIVIGCLAAAMAATAVSGAVPGVLAIRTRWMLPLPLPLPLPHRTAPHCIAPHRAALHCTAPHHDAAGSVGPRFARPPRGNAPVVLRQDDRARGGVRAGGPDPARSSRTRCCRTSRPAPVASPPHDGRAPTGPHPHRPDARARARAAVGEGRHLAAPPPLCRDRAAGSGRAPTFSGPHPAEERLLIFEPSHTSGSYLRSAARSLRGISALSVILMPSGQTSVQHLVMLQ